MTTNAELLARRNAAVPRGVGHATPVYAARAENAEVWDVEGRRYVDFAGGIAVLNTGHRHPKVMAAVAEQAERFTHTAFQVMAYEPYIRLAERLNAAAPFKGPAKTVFFTTGAEAVENAVKIARAATGRSGIIAFTGGFHGRTMMTMALTGKVLPYKKSFGPMPGDVFHVPFPDRASRRHGRRFAQGPVVPVQGRHRARARGRDHDRAGPGRGRLPHRARPSSWSSCAGSATSTASC